MQTTLSPTQKRHTPDQREKILDAYQQSQLTQKEFVAQAGIGLSTLQFWLRKAALGKSPGSSPFVQIPNLLPVSPASATYRLQYPGGLILEIRSGFDPDELDLLLQSIQLL